VRRGELEASRAAGADGFPCRGTGTLTARSARARRRAAACDSAGCDHPAVERLLTWPQVAHARTVLDRVQAHAPHPEAEVRPAVLMLPVPAVRIVRRRTVLTERLTASQGLEVRRFLPGFPLRPPLRPARR
jgi:hypothetical protein